MAVEPQLWIDGREATMADLRQMALVNYGAVTSFGYADGGVRGLDLHLERLAVSCRELFSCELDKSHVLKLLESALASVDEAWVRITVTSPDLSLRAPEQANAVSVGVWLSPPARALDGGQRVKPLRHDRELPHLKHLGMTGVIHARRQSRLAGYDDALLIGEVGMVLEGTLWNIGFVRQQSIVWPQGPLLDGVTRRLLSRGLDQQGTDQRCEVITLDDLGRFDAAFLCNAATPVAEIAAIGDHFFVGRADMVQRLGDAWHSQAVQPI